MIQNSPDESNFVLWNTFQNYDKKRILFNLVFSNEVFDKIFSICIK